jgi:hypothetical protein
MDKLDRAIQRSEEMFFNECDTNNGECIFCQEFLKLTTCPVPVIVLFTKFDALLAVAMSGMRGRKLPIQEKVAEAHELINEIFNNANVWGRLSQLRHAPKYTVRIGGIILCSNNMIQLTEFVWVY